MFSTFEDHGYGERPNARPAVCTGSYPQHPHTCRWDGCGVAFMGPANAKFCKAHQGPAAKLREKRNQQKRRERAGREAQQTKEVASGLV